MAANDIPHQVHPITSGFEEVEKVTDPVQCVFKVLRLMKSTSWSSSCIFQARHRMYPEWKMCCKGYKDRPKGGSWQTHCSKVGMLKSDSSAPSLS